MRSINAKKPEQSGVTLVELLVAALVISVGVLGTVKAYRGIQAGLQSANNKTLASNLAQEKMQIIRQQSYFMVVPTMSPSYLPDGTPYDTSTFPPETILEGGVTFHRYSYIQVISKSGSPLPPTIPDTGARQITVAVEWSQGAQAQKLSIQSIMANPNTVESNAVISGVVSDEQTGLPLSGATVDVAEDIGWKSSTDGTGSYSIQMSPGSFWLAAAAPGYYTGRAYVSIGANQAVSQNFSLAEISSGSAVGGAWVNTHLVISQVVVSTPQADGFVVEYVELYNPTPLGVTVNGTVNLNVASSNGPVQCLNIPLVYVNDSVGPLHYYLIANTTTFSVAGSGFGAEGPGVVDAYYQDGNPGCLNPGSGNPPAWNPPSVMSFLQTNHNNTVYLTDGAGAVIDGVGWTHSGHTFTPSHCEGACVPETLGAGDQIVRTSSPAYIDSSGAFGRAYDSGNNSADFAYPGNPDSALSPTGIQYPPYTSQSAAAPISGAPAYGAIVSATDGLSASTQAYQAGNPPYAPFDLSNIATGTWTVLITSGDFEVEIASVEISSSGSVYILPSSMTVLNSTATGGFISGVVTDAAGVPISLPSPIQVADSLGGFAATADPVTGRYLLRVSTCGYDDVTANPGSANPNYVAVSSLSVPVSLGQVASGVDFSLSQGGKLSGWVTRDGINGLQGVTIIATDSNGNAQDQEVSDVNGNFTTIDVATGTYTLRIPLDTTEISSPTTITTDAASGQTVFAGTFTITGALGFITGNVTLSGSPIATGTLIVATTGALASGPPDLSSATLTSGAFYATSSQEDGSYSLSVRQSTAEPYNIYGYYATMDASGNVSISSTSLSGVTVIQGQTVSGQNLSW